MPAPAASAPAILSTRSGTPAQPRRGGLPTQRSWLLKNATVYPVDAQSTVIANGAVAIEDGIITAVGKTSEVRPPPNSQTLDARGHMIVPGFINPHWHEVSALRLQPPADEEIDDRDVKTTVFSLGGDYVGLVNMFQDFFDLNFVLTPEEAYALSFYGLMNQLRTGTTFVGDMGSINHWDSMARAMLSLGMRGGPSIWSLDTRLDAASGRPASTRPAEKVIAANEAMLSRWAREPTGLVRAQPSMLLPLASSDALIEGLGELAARYDVPFVMHAAAARNENATSERFFGANSIQRLERAGVLSPRLTLAHAAFISDAERELLIAKGVNITHT
ncbi:MAG: amidohydrolase family protein, partial [Steroidobacteraceae bacterium]